MDTRISVRPLDGPDVGRAAETLALASFDDPVGRWRCPNDARRTEAARGSFELQVPQVFAPHEVSLVSSDLAGVALWKPPGKSTLPPLLILRMLPTLGRIFGRRLPLLLRGLNAKPRGLLGGQPQALRTLRLQGHRRGRTARRSGDLAHVERGQMKRSRRRGQTLSATGSDVNLAQVAGELILEGKGTP